MPKTIIARIVNSGSRAVAIPRIGGTVTVPAGKQVTAEIVVPSASRFAVWRGLGVAIEDPANDEAAVAPTKTGRRGRSRKQVAATQGDLIADTSQGDAAASDGPDAGHSAAAGSDGADAGADGTAGGTLPDADIDAGGEAGADDDAEGDEDAGDLAGDAAETSA